MKKNTIILVVLLVVLAAIGITVYQKRAAQAPTTASSTYQGPVSDSPDAIEQDLNSIDTGAQLDADLNATDQDIKSL